MLDWLRGVAASARWICSVCTGNFVLQAAGLAEGRRISNSRVWRWTSCDPPRRDMQWKVNAMSLTAMWSRPQASLLARGQALSLWVVGEIYGAAHARTVRSMLDYNPAPAGISRTRIESCGSSQKAQVLPAVQRSRLSDPRPLVMRSLRS